MNTATNTPPDTMRSAMRKNCHIVTVRTKTAKGEPRRTSISMHTEHADALAAYLGGYSNLLRSIRFAARHLVKQPGDNFSQKVWAEVDARRADYRRAVEST